MQKWSPFVVCLLDDDPSVLKGLGRLFESADLPLKTFNDPRTFLGYARTHRPQVALIDVCMPQMSGLEVQSQLREISPSTRVIVFTGNDNPLLRSTALNTELRLFSPSRSMMLNSLHRYGSRLLRRMKLGGRVR